MAGLYKILSKEGNLYKIKLLDSIKVHPIFSLDNVTDFIRQVSQLLKAELEELVDVAQATMETIELCDEGW